LSPGPQSVTGEFFKIVAEDFRALPKIQVFNKYSGKIIKSSGTIQSLEYLSGKNVSKIVILVHSEDQNDPKYDQRTVELLRGKGRDGRYLVDKYLVVIEYPGTEIALNYKKGDNFSFQGSFIDIRQDPTLAGYPSYDFYIYFKPII